MRLSRDRHRGWTIGAIAVAAATAAVIGIQGSSTAGPGAGAPSGATDLVEPGTHPVVAAGARRTTDVTLVTGDRLRLVGLPDDRQNVVMLPPNAQHPGSGSRGFMRFVLAGDTYVIPSGAVKSLTSVLDVGLFDVSYLVRAGLDDAHSSTVPVVATVTGNAPEQAVPVLRVTGSGAEHPAWVDKAQAWRLGQALTGKATGSALAGVRALALPQSSPGVRPPPTDRRPVTTHGAGVPQRTLTLNAIDRDGNPALAILFAQNVDSAQSYLSLQVTVGSASFSVPEGSYMAAAIILSFHDDGVNFDGTLVSLPQSDVTKSHVTVTLDARTANQLSAAVAGLDTTQVGAAIDVQRESVDGTGFEFGGLLAAVAGLVATNDSRLFAAPTAPVTKGHLRYQEFFILSQGPYNADTSHYYLEFPDPDKVPATVAHAVAASSLTSAENHYHWPDLGSAAACSTLAQAITVYEPWSVFGTGFYDQLSGPQVRTDYLYSPESSSWTDLVQTPACQVFFNAARHIEPGGHFVESWFKAPMHAGGLQQATIAPGIGSFTTGYFCPLCRQDNNFSARIYPFGDSDPTHYAAQVPQTFTGTTHFYRNGKLVMTTRLPFVNFPMLPSAATYRIDMNVTQDQGYWPLSQDVTTSWAFTSNPTSDGLKPPASEQCLPDPTVACTLLPLLFATIDLPLALNNSAPAGPLPVSITIARQQNMPVPTGVSATLSVSCDGGATWTDQPLVKGADNRFTGTLNQPDPTTTKGYVSLRLHASDDQGSTVDQTIPQAYRLSS